MRSFSTARISLLVFTTFFLVILSGCGQDESAPQKKPRPVETRTLKLQTPPANSLVSAVVASWKTEEIGFEVGGRIEWVVEPNTDIEGRIRRESGQTMIEGTPIARIDNERFELQVQSAAAEVNRAEQAIEAAKIELERTIPSQLEAAQAEIKRANIEYERSKRLFAQNAGAEADVDRDEATLKNASAQVDQINASKIAKAAELESLRSALLQAQKSYRDAQRSLEDCVLYSSFRGQISNVDVVPGSVVSAGQAVATLQMMDPIKIELEVSAEESRRLRNRQRLPVMVTMENGDVEEQDGFLYLVDPVADSQTRTFTLTLLLINQRLKGPGDALADLATTEQMWRTDFQFLPGAEQGKLYAPRRAIQEDESGPFLWRATNFTIHQSLPKDNIVEVEKMRITLKDRRLPFLGTWTFCEFEADEPAFDPSLNVIAGRLMVKGKDAVDWDGKRIVVEKSQGQWMLRPGDLVQVDLTNSDASPALYVEMDSIARNNDNSYLFVIEKDGSDSVVRRVEIDILSDENSVSSMLKIAPTNQSEGSLLDRQYVVKGTHYLQDGEKVRVVDSESN